MLAQAATLAVTSLDFSMLPFGLIVFSFLALPLIGAAMLAAWLTRRSEECCLAGRGYAPDTDTRVHRGRSPDPRHTRYCSSRRSRRRNFVARQLVTPTTPRVTPPPSTTPGTRPTRRAIEPAYHAPSSFDEPMNRLLIDDTRPPIASAADSCRSTERR